MLLRGGLLMMMTSHDGIVILLMLLISFPLSLANKSLYSKMRSLFSADDINVNSLQGWRVEGGGYHLWDKRVWCCLLWTGEFPFRSLFPL